MALEEDKKVKKEEKKEVKKDYMTLRNEKRAKNLAARQKK